MIQAVKPLALFTILFALTTSINAQLKLPGTNSNLASDIKKVIQDYPNRFANIQGELLIEHAQSADYACNFKINGAEQATVTVYSSKKHDISSWQALMLTTDDFEIAKKKFKSLYTQLNNLAINLPNAGVFQLRGHYETPVEEKKFTSTVFSFNTDDEAMKKLKVEIVMAYEPMEWKIKVLVYDREREDNERGSTIED